MSSLTKVEQTGITDFLQNLPNNLVIALAKIVSQNLLDVEQIDDAIKSILLHSSSIESILNRKLITKEILFQYLHSKHIAIANAVNKQILIEKIVKYINETYIVPESQSNAVSISSNTTINTTINVTTAIAPQQNETISNDSFPINEMAEAFSKWFFQVYNDNELNPVDFWADGQAIIQIQENSIDEHIQNHKAQSADDMVQLLTSLKDHYKFHFNPNLAINRGVKGIMDVHGLVYVMNCGTLHVNQSFVGIYECAFGLLRDPFCENNWKMKTVKLKLRSSVKKEEMPNLMDCESIQEL